MRSADTVIVGAGPAGLSAALQLTRQGESPLIYEQGQPGGLLWNANLVENYPGFPAGISGPELAGRMVKQVEALGIQIIPERVLEARCDNDRYQLRTAEQKLQCQRLILAMGTVSKPFPAAWNQANYQDRIFSEVVQLSGCSGKHIAIVGVGDAGLDYALNLGSANQVSIFNRSNDIQGLQLLWDRIQFQENITMYRNTEVTAVSGGRSNKLKLQLQSGGDQQTMTCDYLLGALGRKPDVSILESAFLEEIRQGKHKDAVYLIGDLQNGLFRQTSLAVADGIRTAMDILFRKEEK